MAETQHAPEKDGEICGGREREGLDGWMERSWNGIRWRMPSVMVRQLCMEVQTSKSFIRQLVFYGVPEEMSFFGSCSFFEFSDLFIIK